MSSILSLYKHSTIRRTITICKEPTKSQRKHNEQLAKYHKTVCYYGKYEDDVCAPYRDPPRSRGGRGILGFVGALLFASSAVIGYAKYDPKFRKNLVGVAPFTDAVMKVVFQEEKTYYEQLSDLYDQIKNVLNLLEQRKK